VSEWFTCNCSHPSQRNLLLWWARGSTLTCHALVVVLKMFVVQLLWRLLQNLPSEDAHQMAESRNIQAEHVDNKFRAIWWFDEADEDTKQIENRFWWKQQLLSDRDRELVFGCPYRWLNSGGEGKWWVQQQRGQNRDEKQISCGCLLHWS